MAHVSRFWAGFGRGNVGHFSFMGPCRISTDARFGGRTRRFRSIALSARAPAPELAATHHFTAFSHIPPPARPILQNVPVCREFHGAGLAPR
jgi:hypothetical protein